jgi:hypothetical protein
VTATATGPCGRAGQISVQSNCLFPEVALADAA